MDDDQARELEVLEGTLSDPSAELIKLSYGLLRFITDNFSNEIGRGGFGVVYKGGLQNGDVDVAVKKLSNPHELSDKQFLDEITCLKKANHKNIVRFLGYCSETQGELLELNGRHIMAEVQKKMLCFEYVSKGNIQHYLKDKRHGDDWPDRYQMIRGICQGLHYLHDKSIIHLDLKPENVLLDARMEPKITDFGLSRCLDQGKTMFTQPRLLGTPRYIAPEIIDKGEISFKSDIYALGIIIIELLTGISKIDLDNWGESLDMDCPPVRMCTEIARNCTDPDKHNRPTAREVISGLDELESMIPWFSINQLPVNPAAFPGAKMINVYPLQLNFPFVPNQDICCHLNLINKTDGVVIVNIPDRYRGQFKGILPPMCTAGVTLQRKAEEELPSDTEDKFEMLVLITGCHRLDDLEKKLQTLSLDENVSFEDKFKAAHEWLGLELHRAMLTAVVIASEDDGEDVDVAFEAMHTTISKEDVDKEETVILRMDVHPTEPWVLILGFKKLYIWNWQSKERIGVYVLQESNERIGEYKPLFEFSRRVEFVVKFISREQWAVIGNRDGSVLVFICPTMDLVKEFEAHRDGEVSSLAVHPTLPFLLSSSYSAKSLKLWDWKNDWSCTAIFDITSPVRQVMFDPEHASDFATLHGDQIAMTWRIGRRDPIATMKLPGNNYYGAVGFTYTGHRHYIAAPAAANFVHICHPQTKRHVDTLYYDKGRIRAVVCHPTRPVLVNASDDGSIHVWDSTTYRLKKVYGNLPVNPMYIGFTGLERLVIGYEWRGILVMDIDLE